MSSVEEMQELYHEFAANFALLSSKHDGTLKDLEEARQEKRKLEAAVAELRRDAQAHVPVMEDLRSEINNMQQYKERYYATCVAMEHLKGKLEAAWKSKKEREEEHQSAIDQLKSQMQSLSHSADTKEHAAQVQTLRNRIVELEERCAVLSGHALSEKERVSHQNIASNSTLRDLQARNATLEQQSRNLNGEIRQLRTMLRRSQDAHTDMTKQLNDSEVESKRLSSDMALTEGEISSLKGRLLTERKSMEEASKLEQLQLRTNLDKTREELSEMKKRVASKDEALLAMESKLRHSEESAHGRVLQVREELRSEIDTLRTDKMDITGELQSVTRSLAARERQLHELQQALSAAERRASDLDRQRGELSSTVESLQQQVSYVKADLSKRTLTVNQLQQQVMAAKDLESQLHLRSVEVDRMRMQLSFAEEGHMTAAREAQSATEQLRQFEKEASRRYKDLFKQLKAAESSRAKKERSEGRRSHNHVSVVSDPLPPVESAFDVLQVLRQQSEQAEGLNRALTALSTH